MLFDTRNVQIRATQIIYLGPLPTPVSISLLAHPGGREKAEYSRTKLDQQDTAISPFVEAENMFVNIHITGIVTEEEK